ncbi:MAG: glycosyltransferase family 4 protein [Bacteroidetes bacterium]|nr:glycosyltransferase family 4 protein [Bacteroidota bacterium]
MHNGYPTESNPKHSSFVKNIKESLDAAGHDVSLLVLQSDFTGSKEHFIQYIRFYKKIWKHDFSRYDYVFMSLYPYYALPITRSLSKMKQPVIHWHGDDLYVSKIKAILFTPLIKKLPARTLHITPSEYFKQELADQFKYPLSKIFPSPSGGIDTGRFTENNNIDENSNTIKLGFASGLIPEKGTDLLIKVLEQTSEIEKAVNKKIQLHYIFYGKEKNRYKAVFSNFDNTVCWEVMPTSEMQNFYHAIDILLFPTMRRQESLGLVSLEAMSCGKPVVGTDAFAIKEYVLNGKSGERFEMNNSEKFIEAIITVIKNIHSYSPRTIVEERYSQHSVIDFYKTFFK